MLWSIPIEVGQCTNAVNSILNTFSTEQQAVKDKLTNFLKNDLPNLLSKKANDIVEEFKTNIDRVDKTINNWQEIFKIKLQHINEFLHNNTRTITQEI